MRNLGLAALPLALALTACGSPKDEAPAGEATTDVAATEATVPDGKTVFAQCSACHSVEPGRNGIGPSMSGVVGAKAGHLGDAYRYSDALKNSGLTWDAATLDKWLTAPAKEVPGTKMAFAGMPDEARRKALIEYLATLK